MNELARRPLPFMTTEEFLAWPGDGSGRKYELCDGEVRPVSPATYVHGLIQANLAFLMVGAIRAAGLPLFVVTEGAVIPGLDAAKNVRIPDLVVTTIRAERGIVAVPDPVAVVEILSPSNAGDTRANVQAYATLPFLREIVVIRSTRVLAEVRRRGSDGGWPEKPEEVKPGQRLHLPGIGLDCRIEDAYEGSLLPGA